MRQTDVQATFAYDESLDFIEFHQRLAQFFYDNGMTLISSQTTSAWEQPDTKLYPHLLTP